jgi:hypothetical protein
MTWQQTYNPLHNVIISMLAASFPLIVLLASIVFLKMKAHSAAGLGLLSALLVAIGIFRMPSDWPLRPQASAPPSVCCRLAGSYSMSFSCTA